MTDLLVLYYIVIVISASLPGGNVQDVIADTDQSGLLYLFIIVMKVAYLYLDSDNINSEFS